MTLQVPLPHRSELVLPYRCLANVPVWTHRAVAVWHCFLGLPHCIAKTHLSRAYIRTPLLLRAQWYCILCVDCFVLLIHQLG